MIVLYQSLNKSIFFKNLSNEQIKYLMDDSNYKILTYDKNEVIFLKGDNCNSIGFILEGKIEIQKPFHSGKIISLNIFSQSHIFGEALVFSKESKYPVNVISLSKSKILFLNKDDLLSLMMKNKVVMNNFVSLLSNRLVMLNEKISNLSLDTISKKIANLLLRESYLQDSNYIELNYNRSKMAEMLNIPRPSLSRELIKLKNQGIIDYDKNTFKILDECSLENILLD